MDRREQLVQRAKEDLYFFCKDVLNYQKMSSDPHHELCDAITNKSKLKKLILMPRGSYKSSVVTIGSSLHDLVNDPNKRILICHELQKNANKFVMEIKTHIEANPKFRALFGDWVPAKGLWRSNEFIVSSRTQIKKEPTVMSGSLERGVQVGLHFDKIILDDPVSQNNSRTIDQVEKTIEFYKLLLSILDPGGELIIIGTRWNVNDLYGWILSSQERDKFLVVEKSAEDEDGNPTMPEILSKDFLDDIKETQGDEIFSHQYLNKAIPRGGSTFDIKDVKFYEEKDLPSHCIHFITIDTAISLNTRSDFTAFIVNAVDYNNHYWIREAFQLKLKPHETVDMVFELAKKYTPLMGIGLETSMTDQAVKERLFEEMEKRKEWCPVVDVKVDTRISKEKRIRWLEPKFKQGQIHLKREHQDLLQQIEFHPQIRHDDLLDALKNQIKITFPSDEKPIQKIKDKLIDKASHKEWEFVKKMASRRVRQRRLTRII